MINNEVLSKDLQKFSSGNLKEFIKTWKDLDFGGISCLDLYNRKELIYSIYSIILSQINDKTPFFLFGFFKASGSKWSPILSLEEFKICREYSKSEPNLLEFIHKNIILSAKSVATVEKYQNLLSRISNIDLGNDPSLNAFHQLLRELKRSS